MTDELATKLHQLAQREAETRERAATVQKAKSAWKTAAQKAATDLAEAVDDALSDGATLQDVRRWTGWAITDLEALLDVEKNRIYNRRYRRDWQRIKLANETEEQHRARLEAARGRFKRRKQTGLPPGDPRHGTSVGRNHWGCGCAACRAADSSPQRLQKRRERRASMTPEALAELRRKDAERKRAARRREVGSGGEPRPE